MAGDNRSNELLNILPSSMATRLRRRVNPQSTKDALRKLCDSGDYEFAMLLLEYITGLGDAKTLFMAIPSDKRPVECNIHESTNTLFVHLVIENEAGRDESCIAMDDYESVLDMIVRPCTLNEWKYVKNEENTGDSSIESITLSL